MMFFHLFHLPSLKLSSVLCSIKPTQPLDIRGNFCAVNPIGIRRSFVNFRLFVSMYWLPACCSPENSVKIGEIFKNNVFLPEANTAAAVNIFRN